MNEEVYQAPGQPIQQVEQSSETVTEGSQVGQDTAEDRIIETDRELMTILRDIHSDVKDVKIASDAVITYAVYYIPLAVIVWMMFRFFHTFIKDYR